MPAEVVFLVCLGHERVIAVFRTHAQAAEFVSECESWCRMFQIQRSFDVHEFALRKK